MANLDLISLIVADYDQAIAAAAADIRESRYFRRL